MVTKPTPKEINNKLSRAREIICNEPGQIVIIERGKWDEEWERFRKFVGLENSDVELFEDRLKIIADCLDEIKSSDHVWRGKRMYCNKMDFNDVELWEFRWLSTMWDEKDLYIKFGFRFDNLCFLSFHPDEPERRKN
ncbi:MAG: hypothetical protein R3A13_01430 [Bdellovibrionota bacterium]